MNTDSQLVVFGVTDYCSNLEDTKMTFKKTDKLIKLLEIDQDAVSYHLRLYNDVVYPLYCDMDEGDKSLEDVIEYFNDYYKTEIAITKSETTKKNSFHIVIKNYEATQEVQKAFFTTWNKEHPDYKVDTTVYSNNRLFRLPNQLKPYSGKHNNTLMPETRHFIMRGTMEDFLLQRYTEAQMLQIPEKVNHTAPSAPTASCAETDMDKLIECLSTERATNYETWRNVGFCLRNIEKNQNDNLKYFIDFSKKMLGHDPEYQLAAKYVGFKPKEDKSNLGTLRAWAKTDNPELYKKYFPTKCLLNEDAAEDSTNYFMCSSIFFKGMREMCIAIHQELLKTMRYCLDNWYVFDKKSGLWCSIKNPASKFIELFNKYFNYNIIRITKELMKEGLEPEKKEFLLKDRKLFTEACVKYDSPGAHSNMKTHFSDLLKDDKFIEKLDILTDCIAFENGIYNLKTGVFTHGIKYDDYLTCKLNLEYLDDIDISEAEERVEKVIKQICSMEEWRFKYYKSILGYAMTGRANEQQAFYSMTGLGSNGKSFIFEKLSKIFPQYVYKIPSNTFEKDCKDYNKNISTVIGKRIVWSNELSKNKPCDADKLKDFSDGTIMNIPFLYQQKPVCIQNYAKLFLIANQNPKFASDGGIDRRIRTINFISRFYKKDEIIPFPANPNPNTDYWVDDTIDSFFDSHHGKIALFKFIAEGAKMYFEEGLKTPIQFKELAEEVANANNQFIEFINENFELVEEGKGVVQKEEVMMAWRKEKGKDCNFDDLRSELIRRKYIYDYKKQKKMSGKVKTGCFTNMKIIASNNCECLLDDDNLSQASTN